MVIWLMVVVDPSTSIDSRFALICCSCVTVLYYLYIVLLMLLMVLGKKVNLLAQEDLLHALSDLGQESEPPCSRGALTLRTWSWIHLRSSWARKRTSLPKRISYALLVVLELVLGGLGQESEPPCLRVCA
jgi:hypothetical protein